MPVFEEPATLDAEIVKVYNALKVEGAKTMRIRLWHYDTALRSYDPIDLIFEQYKDAAVSFVSLVDGATAYMRIDIDGEKVTDMHVHYEVLPEGFQTTIRSGAILKVLEACTTYLRDNADDIALLLAP